MDIWFHRYELRPKRPLSALARDGARKGALIRSGSGFADIHPWPELDDAPLDQQLAMLARGETTPLTRASLRLAAADAAAREKQLSLFEGLTIPPSHWPGPDPPEEFTTAKVKGGQPLPDRVRLRIDFNASLSAEEFLRIAPTLPRGRIDFIEDPVPYHPEVWQMLRERTRFPLALDRCDGAAQSYPGVDVLVHKPAIAPEWPRFEGGIVVTSYMDHPVGQFGAAWVAASHGVTARCGLFTHVLYEPDAFLEQVTAEGDRLQAPQGSGIGFGELLERLPWRPLR